MSSARKFVSGRVTYLCDGIATVTGLEGLKAGEIVFFLKNTVTDSTDSLLIRGLVLNLNLNNAYVIVLGNEVFINEQTLVFRSNSLFNVNTSLQMFGGVFDALGQSKESVGLLNYNTIECSGYVEKKALGIVDRVPVNVPLRTGLKAVDSLVPIGRGQRELIIGDRQTGKTSVAVDAILNHAEINNNFLKLSNELTLNDLRNVVWFIYCAVGQKQSTVSQIYSTLKKYTSSWFTSIVAATASEPAPLQFLAPYSACTLGEFIRDILGGHCTIIYDDLSKHAVAYRQMSLLLRRPPGREAFPGDVFYVHSRLLERAGALRNITYFNTVNFLNTSNWSFSSNFPRGTLTAFPVIETQAGDVSAYIPTNVISITDGQIFLETELFHKGIRPAINVGLSVSRVGSAAQPALTKKVTGSLKIDLAQFREIEGFAKLGASLDEHTQRLLTKGENLIEILKQKLNAPLSTIEQAVSIFLGVGYSSAWLNAVLKIKHFNKNSFVSQSRLRISWFELFRLSSVNFSLADVSLFLSSLLNFVQTIGVKSAFNFVSTEQLTTMLVNKFPLFFFDDLIIAFLLENSKFTITNSGVFQLTNLNFLNTNLTKLFSVNNFKLLNIKNTDSSKSIFSVLPYLSKNKFFQLVNSNNTEINSNLIINNYISIFFNYIINQSSGIILKKKDSFNKINLFSQFILNSFVEKNTNLFENIVVKFKQHVQNNLNLDISLTFLKQINTYNESNFSSLVIFANEELNKKVFNKVVQLKLNHFLRFGLNIKKINSIRLITNLTKLSSFIFDLQRFEVNKFNFYTFVLNKFVSDLNSFNKLVTNRLGLIYGAEFLNSVFSSLSSSFINNVYFNKTFYLNVLLNNSVLDLKRFNVFFKKMSNVILQSLDNMGFYFCNIFYSSLISDFGLVNLNFCKNYYNFNKNNKKIFENFLAVSKQNFLHSFYKF